MKRVMTDISRCVGCTACVNVCPKQSITMEPNSEGFMYPLVNKELCINCGLCEKVCPLNQEKKKQAKVDYYLVQNSNTSIRERSTSGGAFAAIAEYIITHNGKVYGAGFDENTCVVHKGISDVSEIDDLCGSKYVQSDLNIVFDSISRDLRFKLLVLFAGTPCQVAGLISYLKRSNVDTKNLYIIELKCYGVPSPGLFKKYVSYLEDKYNKKVQRINFRDKTYGYATTTVKVFFEDGKKVLNNYSVKSYSRTFFHGLNMRRSCYECSFRDYYCSKADYIVGDFHDIQKYNKEMNDDLGVSLMIVKSNKGKTLLNELNNMKCVKLVDYKEEIPKNPKINEKRNAFFADSVKMNWGKLIQKYCPNSWWDTMVSILKPIIKKMPFSNFVFSIISRINSIKYKIRTK